MKIDECELEMKLNLRKRNLIEKKREWMRMEGIFSKIIYNRFKFYKYQSKYYHSNVISSRCERKRAACNYKSLLFISCEQQSSDRSHLSTCKNLSPF